MEDTFVLRIELGDDAMQTGGDIAEALRATANKIDTRRIGALDDSYGSVIDVNGNTVGEWEIQ